MFLISFRHRLIGARKIANEPETKRPYTFETCDWSIHAQFQSSLTLVNVSGKVSISRFNSFSPIPKYNFQSVAVRERSQGRGDLVCSGERVDESDTPIVSPATLSLAESSRSLTLPPCYLVNCHSTSSSWDIPLSFVLRCSFSVFFAVELGHTNRYCSCF